MRWCSLHQNSLIESTLCSYFDTKMIGALYSISCLLKGSGYFIRVLHCLPKVLEQLLVVRRGAPPSPDDLRARFSAELESYSSRNHRLLQHEADDEQDRTRQTVNQRWASAWRVLLAVANGSISGDGTVDYIEHYCTDGACCQNYDRSVTVERLRKGITGVLLAWLPGLPIVKKWTKLSPAVDYYACLVWFADLLRHIFPLAFKAFTGRAGKATERGDDLDPDQVADITWGQVRSARVQRGQRFLNTELSRGHLPILAIVLEVTRFITVFHLAKQRQSLQPSESPGLLDLATPARSPLVVAQQYISALLACSGSRLLLLRGRDGVDTMQRWCEVFPERALHLRQSLLMVSAWIHERHVRASESYPYKLAALADDRLSQLEKQDVANTFFSKAPCCIPWGMARTMRQSLTVQALLSRPWAVMLLRWAALIFLAIGDLECRHARNRRLVKGGMAWNNFTAASFNQEVRAMVKQRGRNGEPSTPSRTLVGNKSRRRARRAALLDAAPPGAKLWTRRKSPLEIYREDRLASIKAFGKPSNNTCPPCNPLSSPKQNLSFSGSGWASFVALLSQARGVKRNWATAEFWHEVKDRRDQFTIYESLAKVEQVDGTKLIHPEPEKPTHIAGGLRCAAARRGRDL